MDATLKNIGDTVVSTTPWAPPPNNTMYDGEFVIMNRTIYSKAKVPGKHQYADQVTGRYLVTHSDTAIVIQETQMYYNHTGMDTYVTFVRWEVYQPTVDCPKSVMRRSYAFKWLKKQPQLMGSMIKQVAKDRDSAINDQYWQTFFPNSIDLLQLQQEQGAQTGPTATEQATFESAQDYVDSKLREYTKAMDEKVKSLDL